MKTLTTILLVIASIGAFGQKVDSTKAKKTVTPVQKDSVLQVLMTVQEAQWLFQWKDQLHADQQDIKKLDVILNRMRRVPYTPGK